METIWRVGTAVLAVLLIMPGAARAIEAADFLQAMERDLAQSTQVLACQDCPDDRIRLAALDAAAAGMPFVDSDRENLVYVVDPVRDVVRSFRYSQQMDGRGASAHVILADGSDRDRQAIREALDFYHAITGLTEVEFSSLPRSETEEFDSAFDLAAHEYARRRVGSRLRDYIQENIPFETGGSRVGIAAFGALTGLLKDKFGLPSENDVVRVNFADGSSWAFELESFNLEITSGSTSVDVAFKNDGGLDPAGNRLFPDRGSMFDRNIDGDKQLISRYVDLAEALDLETDKSALSSDAERFRLRCEPRRDPMCVVRPL